MPPKIYKKKSATKRKPLGKAKSQANLSQKVNYLMKMNKIVKQTNYYKHAESRRIGDGVYVFNTADAMTVHQATLTRMVDWQRVFGTQPNDEVNKSCLIKTLAVKMALDVRNYNTRTPGYSVFVVSPTKLSDTNFDHATGLFTNMDMDKHWTADFSTNPAQADLGHDCQPDTVFLNLDYFKIHYYRTFRLGNADDNVNPTDTKSSVKEMKFSIKKPIMITNPSGDWKDLPTIADTAKNLVLLVFCNRTGIPLNFNCKFDFNSLVGVETSS